MTIRDSVVFITGANRMDTDMTHGFDMKKVNPRQVAEAALGGIEANKEEVLADEFTREVKQSLCTEQPMYLDPAELARNDFTAPDHPPLSTPHSYETDCLRAGAAVALAGLAVFVAPAAGQADGEAAPIFVTDIPHGYRDWRLISVAHEEGDLNDLRAILGNDLAINAYREGKLPFPDGTIIARLAWNYGPSE